MDNGDYIIVGDTRDFADCLIYTCYTKENAELVLKRMITNPTTQDEEVLKTHTRLRIKFVPREACWWKDGTD